jgi:hypothetical protein
MRQFQFRIGALNEDIKIRIFGLPTLGGDWKLK